VDAHRLLASLSAHGQRLSRQFQKTLNQLHELQLGRLERQRKDLRDAASVFQFHKHKGLPDNPAEDGFVFSKTVIEAFAQRTMRLNEAWKVEDFTYDRVNQEVCSNYGSWKLNQIASEKQQHEIICDIPEAPPRGGDACAVQSQRRFRAK